MSRPFIRRAIVGTLGASALALFGIVVGLGLTEIGFTIYHWRHPSTARGFFWVPHPEYGWGLAANREGPFYNDQQEFQTRVRINSRGLRDVEHSYAKAPGVFRILILGDSYMEALQVNLQEMFARLLEADLQQGAKQKIEVINTGVSSYGTDNELLFFRHEGYKYEPDLVLLAFTTGNDVRENYEPFNRETLDANLSKPSFRLDENGSLQMQAGPPPPPPIPWWRKHFYVGEYLYLRIAKPVFLPMTNPFGILPPKDNSIPFVAPDIFVYSPNERPEVAEAWRVTEALLRQLRREVTDRGARFAVMVHSPPWAHYNQRWSYMTMRHPIARDTWDPQKPNRRIDAFLSEQRVPFLDLFEIFEREKDREPLFFQVDPHWRPVGHRLAARSIAEFLRRADLVPSSGS